jgi:hypothetical protein
MIDKKVYIISKGCCLDNSQLPDNIKNILASMKLRNLDEISRNFIAACLLSINDSGSLMSKGECPLFFGTEYGPIDSIHSFDMCAVTNGALKVNPSLFPNTVLNSITCQTGLKLSLGGMMFTVYNGRNSGFDALGLAYYHLLDGISAEVVAGAADEVTPLQQKVHGKSSCKAAAAAFSLVGSEESSTFAKNALAFITGYNSFADFTQDGDRNIDVLAGLIKSLAESSGQAFDFAHLSVTSVGEADYLKKALDASGFIGTIAVGEDDYMSVSGMLLLIERLSKSFKGSGTFSSELFVSADSGRISLLSVLIPVKKS